MTKISLSKRHFVQLFYKLKAVPENLLIHTIYVFHNTYVNKYSTNAHWLSLSDRNSAAEPSHAQYLVNMRKDLDKNIITLVHFDYETDRSDSSQCS